jgi:hypothetical protein
MNRETGRTLKRDDTQHLIEKSNGQNFAQLMNDSFISTANNITYLFMVLSPS